MKYSRPTTNESLHAALESGHAYIVIPDARAQMVKATTSGRHEMPTQPLRVQELLDVALGNEDVLVCALCALPKATVEGRPKCLSMSDLRCAVL